MYGYNAEPPIAIPIYTVLPYCVIRGAAVSRQSPITVITLGWSKESIVVTSFISFLVSILVKIAVSTLQDAVSCSVITHLIFLPLFPIHIV